MINNSIRSGSSATPRPGEVRVGVGTPRSGATSPTSAKDARPITTVASVHERIAMVDGKLTVVNVPK